MEKSRFERRPRYAQPLEQQEYQFKIDLTSFDGHLDVEKFLDWIQIVESFFFIIWLFLRTKR